MNQQITGFAGNSPKLRARGRSPDFSKDWSCLVKINVLKSIMIQGLGSGQFTVEWVNPTPPQEPIKTMLNWDSMYNYATHADVMKELEAMSAKLELLKPNKKRRKNPGRSKLDKKIRRLNRRKPQEVDNADAGRLVRKAAEFLEDQRWTKNSLHNPVQNSYCIAGALNRVYCGNAQLDRRRIQQIPILKLTYNLLDEFLEAPIERWNDVISTNREDVLQKLHKFADEHDPKRI